MRIDDFDSEDGEEYETTINRENDNDDLICENCDSIMKHESDLFYHDNMYVCEPCLDDLRRLDEIEYQEWEREDFEDYD